MFDETLLGEIILTTINRYFTIEASSQYFTVVVLPAMPKHMTLSGDSNICEMLVDEKMMETTGQGVLCAVV